MEAPVLRPQRGWSRRGPGEAPCSSTGSLAAACGALAWLSSRAAPPSPSGLLPWGPGYKDPGCREGWGAGLEVLCPGEAPHAPVAGAVWFTKAGAHRPALQLHPDCAAALLRGGRRLRLRVCRLLVAPPQADGVLQGMTLLVTAGGGSPRWYREHRAVFWTSRWPNYASPVSHPIYSSFQREMDFAR